MKGSSSEGEKLTRVAEHDAKQPALNWMHDWAMGKDRSPRPPKPSITHLGRLDKGLRFGSEVGMQLPPAVAAQVEQVLQLTTL